MASPIPGVIVLDHAGPERPWLTMLHGLSQHSGVFSAQVPLFRERYRLLLVDLPGHGGAAQLPGPFGPGDHVAHVERALEAAGVDATHLWGTHTGAGVALVLAARDPARCLALVLEGAVILGRQPQSVHATLTRVRARVAAGALADAVRLWLDEAAWFDVMRRHPERCRWAGQRAMVETFGGAPWRDARPGTPVEDVAARLGGLPVPVLLVNGEHDLPDFLATADFLRETLPDVRQAIIPDGGGFPGWEFPDRVNPIVARFLAAKDGRTTVDR